MFDRKKYKQFAKIQLKKRWTVPVLATILVTIITSIINGPDFVSSLRTVYQQLADHNFDFTSVNLATTTTHASFTQLLSFLGILVIMVLEIAQINLYVKMSKTPDAISFGDFTEGFSLWARGILAQLWATLWETLWTLLFIIPGIVKHYAYSMQIFLVAEYHDLSVTKALKISMILTKGHKMDLFVMDLSFLGWAILCSFTAGIGYFWLTPYYNMTLTNAYHALLKEAVASGQITLEDLTESN